MPPILHKWRWLAALLAATTLIASPAHADGLGLSVERVDAAQYPTVRAYVSVANGAGVPIVGLDEHAFQVQEDGKPVDGVVVESLVDSQEPIAIGLAIDVSGSMADENKLQHAKDAASGFVDALGPNDQVSVVSFADNVQVVQDYTSDKTALKSAINGLAARGNTLLYDAVAQSSRRQAAQNQRRRVLIVLTDGQDTKSTASLEDDIAAATSAASPVFAVGLGSDVSHDSLDRLTSATGGQAVYLDDPARLKATFLSVGDLLRHQYVLRYVSSLNRDDKPHGVAVQVTYSGQQLTGLGSFTVPAPPAVPTPPPAPTPAPTSVPTPQPVTPTPVPTVQSAPIAPTPVPDNSAQPSLTPGIDALLAAGLLVLLLVAGIAAWFVAAPRRKSAPSRADSTVQARPRSDMTEAIEDGSAADLTVVRPGPRVKAPDARLLISRQGEQREVMLDSTEVTVGRDQGSQVAIDDPVASRKHCRILRDNGAFFVEDMRSLNGTHVNGEPVTRRQLANNDQISIGETVLTFKLDGDRRA